MLKHTTSLTCDSTDCNSKLTLEVIDAEWTLLSPAERRKQLAASSKVISIHPLQIAAGTGKWEKDICNFCLKKFGMEL